MSNLENLDTKKATTIISLAAATSLFLTYLVYRTTQGESGPESSRKSGKQR